MTDPNDKEKQLGAMLDQSADSDALEQRFAQMRERALGEIDAVPKYGKVQARPMVYGAAAATVLSVAVFLTMNIRDELGVDHGLSEMALLETEDADMFTSDDPEFYLWLDEQGGEPS